MLRDGFFNRARTWALFSAPWNPVFEVLAWPARALERARMRAIFDPAGAETTSRLQGGDRDE